MAKVAWLERYSVGVDELDEQHRALFRTVNQLQDAIDRGQRYAVVAAFSSLMDYAHGHFAHEEAHMEHIGYEGLAEHKAEHARFLERVTSLWQGFLADDSAVGPELLTFLGAWLVEHVGGADQDYTVGASEARGERH